MSAGDSPGTVTICARGRMGLYADDLGVTVRRSASRADRFGWAEVSRFADGCHTDDRGCKWVLLIVLHAGREVPVDCGGWAPIPETVRAIREVADRHGIPAEVTGVPMKDGRPPARCLYEDPGGQAGLRYWNGVEWSPLLPPDVTRPGGARPSAGSWSALPMAAEPWAYAAARARRSGVRFAVLAAVAALSTAGLGMALWWHPGMPHRNTAAASLSFVVASFAALGALQARVDRREFLKLDDAANGAADDSQAWRPGQHAGEADSQKAAGVMADVRLPAHPRARQVLFALAPIVSVTVLAWVPFFWLALIRRRNRDWAVCCAYLLAPAAATICIYIASRGSTFAGGLGALIFWVVVLVAPGHALVEFRPSAAVPSWRDARAARAAAARQGP